MACSQLSFVPVLIVGLVFFILIQDGQSHKHGGYKSPCSNAAPCDGVRNFSCDAGTRRCICAPHPEPGQTFIFDNHIHACVPLQIEHRQAFWDCEDQFYERQATKSDEADLGFCKSDHECHVAHNSSGLHCNHSRCSCECSSIHQKTGLGLVQQPSPEVNSCVHRPIECLKDEACVEEYGSHSNCNQNAKECQCIEGADFFHGKCVQERLFNETCADVLECQRGFGRQAICGTNSSRCECADGFSYVSRANRCTRQVNSFSKKPAGAVGFSTPLFVLAGLSVLSVTVLVTLIWYIRNKRKSKHWRLGQSTGLELASCSSSTTVKFDPLDEKNFL